MHICFCINNLGVFGLGSLLTSLLRNCSDIKKLHLYFFCTALEQNAKDVISQLLENENFSGKFEFIDFDPYQEFGAFKPLQNDWTPYGRLLIGDFLDTDQVLYLDTDLIILTDILALSNFNLEDYTVGAVSGPMFKYALESKFYESELKLNPETVSFNSGVLLINLKNWKKHFVKQKLITIANQFPHELLSADQTLLNAYFAGDFLRLSWEYNVFWYAGKFPEKKENVVLHFVGSPKPWDLFGRWLHKGYKTWKAYDPKKWKVLRRKNLYTQIKRYWAIRRSYIKVIFFMNR